MTAAALHSHVMRTGTSSGRASAPWRGEDAIFKGLLAASAVVLLALLAWKPTAEPEPRSALALVRHEILDASILEPAPQADPLRAITWRLEGWLGDTTRVRATVVVAPERELHLRALFARAETLFPAFVGAPPRPSPPLELRLVDRALLNDSTYFDLGELDTVLGLYFTHAKVVYAVPAATEADEVIVHELAHYFYDVYEITLAAEVEEAEARRFVRYVQDARP